MKKMIKKFKLTLAVTVLLAMVLMVGCTGGPTPTPDTYTVEGTVTYNGEALTESASLKASGADLNEDIITNTEADGTFTLTGLAGEVTITATYDGVSAEATVTEATSGLAIGLIGLVNNSELSLDTSTPAYIRAIAVQANGTTADTVTATSSNESVANVEVNGDAITITGVTAGQATITVTSGSGKTAVFDVNVASEIIETFVVGQNIQETGSYELPITLVAEKLLKIETSYYTGDSDTVLYLYDINDNLLAQNDDAPDKASYSRIIKNLTPGDYKISIEEANQDPIQTRIELYLLEIIY
jgi:hypothetical protein